MNQPSELFIQEGEEQRDEELVSLKELASHDNGLVEYHFEDPNITIPGDLDPAERHKLIWLRARQILKPSWFHIFDHSYGSEGPGVSLSLIGESVGTDKTNISRQRKRLMEQLRNDRVVRDLCGLN